MHIKLADYLAASGKSRSAVARELGVSRQAIEQYLTGAATPTLDRALKMRDLFGVSIDTWRKPSKARRVSR